MPIETKQAIEWAIDQSIVNAWGITEQITVNTCDLLVDKVRQYFNSNGIAYSTFSYNDLIPFF